MKWELPHGLTVELAEIEISPGRGEGRQIPPPGNGRQLLMKRHGYLLGSLPATDERLAELNEVPSCRVD